MRFYFKYLRYVIRHKYFVFVAGRRTGAPLWQLIIHDWSKFLPSEFIPYARKFHGPSPDDLAHREYMGEIGFSRIVGAPVSDSLNNMLLERKRARAAEIREQRDLAFNVAWLKHQHRNPHHWQHWLLAEDNPSKRLEVPQTSGSPRAFPLPIPDRYIREMVADWMGAGRAITGRWECAEWYEKNRDNLVLEHQTQIRVESLLARHAGLRCLWGCLGGSPTYCKEMGGCEAHSAAFSVDERLRLSQGSWDLGHQSVQLAGPR